MTVRHLGTDGEPATDYWPSLFGLTGLGVAGHDYSTASRTGTYTARLPKGVYFLDATISGSDEIDSRITAPHFEVTEDTTVTLDARTAKPIDITGPDPAAQRVHAEMFTELTTPSSTPRAALSVRPSRPCAAHSSARTSRPRAPCTRSSTHSTSTIRRSTASPTAAR